MGPARQRPRADTQVTMLESKAMTTLSKSTLTNSNPSNETYAANTPEKATTTACGRKPSRQACLCLPEALVTRLACAEQHSVTLPCYCSSYFQQHKRDACQALPITIVFLFDVMAPHLQKNVNLAERLPARPSFPGATTR